MKMYEVVVLSEVREDLQEGKIFYDSNQVGIGDYFFDSLISDIESLKFYAGIHKKQYGLYRMLSKKFPFAIYYYIKDATVFAVAVLDLRRNPSWIRTE